MKQVLIGLFLVVFTISCSSSDETALAADESSTDGASENESSTTELTINPEDAPATSITSGDVDETDATVAAELTASTSSESPPVANAPVGVAPGFLAAVPNLFAPTDNPCLLYTSPSPRDRQKSRMPSSA